MASCDVQEGDHWPTLFSIYKMDILKLSYKAHNQILPDLLSKDIYSRRSNGYALRGDDSLLVPRSKTRYTKDSFAYKGAILWNTICLNELGFLHTNQNELYNRLKTKSYFRDFKFNIVSASVVLVPK